MKTPKGWKVLKPIHPNAGIAADYQRRLDYLIADMQASYDYWLKACYRANKPEMALDASAPRRRVTAIQTQVGNAKWKEAWFAYVDGEMLVTPNGVRRVWQSREAAEIAGLKAAGPSGVLTKAFPFSDWSKMSPAEFLRTAEPLITPAQNLQETLDWLGERWAEKIGESAPKLANWFASTNAKRTNDGLRKILKDGGFSIEFQMTPVMRDVFEATVAENVGLIKSIGTQYHTEVQGMVMRSVAAGRDLGTLSTDLQRRYGITRRRAALIAHDQNNKMTGAMVTARQVENGLMAMWLHSAGGKEPRPTHVANSGKIYDPAEGWFDPDPKVRRRIRPGELIKCRCVSRTVVKGFS